MSGICGWFGDAGGSSTAVIDAMQRRFAWRHPGARATAVGTRFGIAAVGPAGTATIYQSGPIHVAIQGHPEWRDQTGGTKTLDKFAAGVAAAWLRQGDEFLARIAGDFALALVDESTGRVLLAIDRIGVRNIVFQSDADNMIFGATSDVIGAHPHSRCTIAPQAIYDYVYFHMVPGPQTIYKEHARLLPAHFALFEDGRVKTHSYWTLRFVEDRRGTIADFKPSFLEALRAGVGAYADHKRCGAFLSGGHRQLHRIGPARRSHGFAAANILDRLRCGRI